MEIRISAHEMNVLRQLVARPKYGRQLVAGSDGQLALNAIYIILGRMEDKGFVQSEEISTPPGERGPPRRVYSLTGHGARVLAAFTAVFEAHKEGA